MQSLMLSLNCNFVFFCFKLVFNTVYSPCRCDRVVWLEERHFWAFEAVMALLGMAAGLATMARQKILDHRVVQRIQRQVAAGV